MRSFKCLAVLIVVVISVCGSQPQKATHLFIHSIRGGVTCLDAQGGAVRLQRLAEIPLGSAIQIGSNAAIVVFADKSSFGEFHGPLQLSYSEILNGIRHLSGDRDRNFIDVLGSMLKRIAEAIPSYSGEMVDTITPAVVRGDLGSATPVEIIPLSPRNLCVVGDTISFSWLNGGYNRVQVFRILDADYEPIYQVEVKGTTIRLDVRKTGLTPGVAYQWSITVPQASREEVPFRLVDTRVASTIREKLRAAEEMAGGDPVSASLMKGMVYEDHQCYGNAFFEYAATVKADSSEVIRELYSTFLVEKLGLSVRAMETMLPSADSEKPATK
jgi:hypothetical protein